LDKIVFKSLKLWTSYYQITFTTDCNKLYSHWLVSSPALFALFFQIGSHFCLGPA
jgi:hypothetical protein